MLERLKSLIIMAIFTAITIACVEYFLQWQNNNATSSDKMDDGFLLHDKALGWKIRPNWQGKHSHKDFDVNYNINRDGYRLAPNLESNTTKTVLVAGDSFTFGIGVNDNQTFTNLLNKESKTEDKGLNFINLGVPGYSTDQELLLLQKELDKKQAQGVILMVYLGNDLLDNQYPYPLQAEYSKPYFKLNSRAMLELKNYPVPLKPKHSIYTQKTLSSEIVKDFALPAGYQYLSDFQIGQRIVTLLPFNKDDFEAHIKQNTAEQLSLFLAIIDKLTTITNEQNIKLSIGLLGSKALIASPDSIPAIYQRTLKMTI